ncbi:MAG: hypothetical protein SH850_16020 [Planctomycetaceae bacterium]|nr:hypothetical protein [Planctomycetaceae bacterium]
MAATLHLTDRDNDVLRTLTRSIRVASLAQIARNWWNDCNAAELSAMRRLRDLERAGLIRRVSAVVIMLDELSEPLVVWRPGQCVSAFGPLAWRLKRRWWQPPQRTTVFLATAHAARRFGGRRSGRIGRPFQLSHDLGVAEMYFALRRLRPQLANYWIDEDRLAPFRRGEKLPDAILATAPDAQPRLVLEFGGAYGKQRLQDFHDDCDDRGLPYEIW